MKAKQVIIVRRDLKMRKGKLAGQVAHASLGSLLTLFRKYETSDNTTVYTTEFGKDCVLESWLHGIFTKIVVAVDSEEELLALESILNTKEIPSALITDAGNTVFNKPTVTCLGVGPYMSEDLDELLGHLKLL